MSYPPDTMTGMELAHAPDGLDGLDGRPWTDLSHAYGSAEDLPELLRTVAGADEGAAQDPLSTLHESVLHQGTVYSASAEVVRSWRGSQPPATTRPTS